MADTKITGLQTPGAFPVVPSTDVLPIVIVADNSMAASGSTRKVTVNQILSAGGTATLASATITGDLTVKTNVLKVDTTNNRVGVGTASPAAGAALSVLGTTSVSASDYTVSSTWASRFQAAANNQPSGILLSGLTSGGAVVPGSLHVEPVAASSRSALIATYAADSAVGYFAINRFSPSAATTSQHFKIDDTGVATWSNVGGVAGTAMTLNATGLTIGGSAIGKLTAYSTTNGDILAAFRCTGTGTQRALYISADNSTGVVNLDVTGSAAGILQFKSGGTNTMQIDTSGNVGIGVAPSANGEKLNANGTIVSSGQSIGGFAYNQGGFDYSTSTKNLRIYAGTSNATGSSMSFVVGTSTSFLTAMTVDASGNLGIGITTPTYKLDTQVAGGADRSILRAAVSGVSGGFNVNWNHATLKTRVIIENIPTSSAGLPAGTLWNDAGTIKIA